MARSSAVLALALTLTLGACSTQHLDPIQSLSTPPDEACSQWLTQSDCLADTAHGCSFQPNAHGCKTTDSDCAPGECLTGDPFVRRRAGQKLWLHERPFRFVGTVSWGIAWGRSCTLSTLPDQTTALARTFDDLVDLQLTVLKVWAFQSYAGASGRDYSSFDRLVAASRRAGVRLIFVLENQYATSCTTGPARDDAWYGGGYASPYGDYALSLPDYARGLAAHFRDEPTILAWEIMHEGGSSGFDAVNGFAAAMSAALRDTDPNHLVALGADNGNTSATDRSGSPSNYERLNDHPALDLLDAHDFFAPDVPLTSSMTELVPIADSLDLPAFAGATAVELDDTSSASFRTRAERVEAKLHAAFDAGYVGFLIYDYIPDWTEVTWSFDTRSVDPLAGADGVLVRNAITAP